MINFKPRSELNQVNGLCPNLYFIDKDKWDCVNSILSHTYKQGCQTIFSFNPFEIEGLALLS